MRTLLTTAATAAFCTAIVGMVAPAAAVDFPCRNIKVIAQANAGGSTDLGARMTSEMANKLGAKPKLQVVNMGAQGGAEAMAYLQDSKPDGCTLMYGHWNPTLLYITGRSKIHPAKDFEPVALISTSPRAIGAAKEVPYNNIAEMIDYVKANGSDSVVAGATLGATSHFEILLVAKAGGVKIKTVSYNHSRERLTALLANNIQLGDMGALAAGGYIKKGQLKALGVLAAKRSPAIPDVPTALEVGYDVQFAIDHGFYAPKGTPKAVIDYYVDLFGKVTKDAGFIKKNQVKDVHMRFMPSGEYKAFLMKNFEELKAIAIDIGIYEGK